MSDKTLCREQVSEIISTATEIVEDAMNHYMHVFEEFNPAHFDCTIASVAELLAKDWDKRADLGPRAK